MIKSIHNALPTCRRVGALVAASALALLAAPATAAPTAAPSPAPEQAAGCTSSVPFTSGTEGYFAFRIPAVVQAGQTVVAFAEGRKAALSDYGDIDVVARRSTDGGCTWGPMTVVADAGADTIGNPAPVVDQDTGRITLLTCHNPNDTQDPRRVFAQHSDDDGVSWSAPRDITADVMPEHWDWYATGPGHGIALRHGDHAGRLLIPANHTYDDGRYGAHSLVSDDGGATWRLGYVAQPAGEELLLNENSLAELPDGRIYSNVRDHHGTDPATRADAYLAPGGTELLAPYEPAPELAGPVVQGSTLTAERGGGAAPALLYAGPADPAARAAMTLRVSEDGGATWRDGPRLSGDPAAYSDLVQLDQATVGVLYETGPLTAYDTITFTRVATAVL